MTTGSEQRVELDSTAVTGGWMLDVGPRCIPAALRESAGVLQALKLIRKEWKNDKQCFEYIALGNKDNHLNEVIGATVEKARNPTQDT